MRLKKSNFYNYCFSRLYDSFENKSGDVFIFWSEWRALLVISFLLTLVMYDLLLIFYLLTKINLLTTDFSLSMLSIIFGAISIFNYHRFLYKDKWKILIKEIDNLSEKETKKKKWIFRISIFLTIFILILGFYLVYVLKKSNYL